MSRGAQLQIGKSRLLKNPNVYVQALLGEYKDWAFDEERAPLMRGNWRQQVFHVDESTPLDFEIGTGNGNHFAYYAQKNPERCFVGAELKYKPLIQSIRRAVRAGSKNARIVRYNARLIWELFGPKELNHVLIHFPDPWSKLHQQKHRLIQDEFLAKIFDLQRSESHLEFKTDNRDYFDWALERFERSPYRVERVTFDLHRSEWAQENFTTHFESIFLRKSLPIHYARLLVP